MNHDLRFSDARVQRFNPRFVRDLWPYGRQVEGFVKQRINSWRRAAWRHHINDGISFWNRKQARSKFKCTPILFVLYSGDLNIERYSNGLKEVGCQMVWYSNVIWILDSPAIWVPEKWMPSCFLKYWSWIWMVSLVHRNSKSSVLKCFRYSNGWYSDPHSSATSHVNKGQQCRKARFSE